MDTEACWTVAETAMFARHGLPFGPHDKATLIGRSIPVAAAVMAERFRRPDESAAIQAEITALAAREIAARAEPMPGARKLIALLGGRLPLGVASNATRALLEAALAFEDSITGARSARAAGLKVVGIPTLASPDFPADLVAGSLDDARLLDWVRGWWTAA